MSTSAQNSWIEQVAKGTGLNLTVVQAWVNTENGWGINNPLGVNGGKTYSSLSASATDTINLLNTSSNYAGIRLATKSTPQAQAQAIVASPWEGHNYTNYASPPPIVQLANSGNSSGSAPWDAILPAVQDWLALFGGVGGIPVSGQKGPAVTSLVPNTANAVTSATGIDIFGSVGTAVGFIGVLLIGLVFILGAFMLSKGDKGNVQIIPMPI